MKVSYVLQSIVLSKTSFISIISNLVKKNNRSFVSSMTAFSVPDEDVSPLYLVKMHPKTRSIMLVVNKDWYAGMQSAKRRAAKLSTLRARETEIGIDRAYDDRDAQLDSAEGGLEEALL